MTVRTFVEDSRFSIIQPVICDPDTRIIISESISEFKDWVDSSLVQDAPIVAFDTETTGLDYEKDKLVDLMTDQKQISLAEIEKFIVDSMGNFSSRRLSYVHDFFLRFTRPQFLKIFFTGSI